jgi:hypothetical protein
MHGDYDEATPSELCDVASDLLKRAVAKEHEIPKYQMMDRRAKCLAEANAMRRRASLYLTEAERRAECEAQRTV